MNLTYVINIIELLSDELTNIKLDKLLNKLLVDITKTGVSKAEN